LLLNAETAQIEDVNPFLMNMLGYSYEEFLGRKIWEIGAFKDTALNEINALRGVTFDAQVVDACLRVFREQGYKIEI
jgi:PAS domain-containing protein